MKRYKYGCLFAFVIITSIFTSCNEESIDNVNDPIPYEPIAGYETSDDVAADHLLTRLSFNDDLIDSKNNITGTVGTKVAFAGGAKGNAYSGSSVENRYAIGNGTAKITGLNSFTLSFWLNSANTVPDGGSPGQGKGAQGIFSIVRPLEFWGGINVFLENQDTSHPDRLRIKLMLQNGRSGVEWKGQEIIMDVDDGVNKWVHIVFSYNPATSTASCYVNGALNKTSDVWYASDPGGPGNPNNAPKYGDFEMVGTNGQILFGSHQFETDPPLNNGEDQGWATSLVGLLDEFRIYDSALTNSEVTALYKLEKDNR